MNKKVLFPLLAVVALLMSGYSYAQAPTRDIVIGSGEPVITQTPAGAGKIKITVHTGIMTLRYDDGSNGYLAGVKKGVGLLKQGAPDMQKLSYAIQVPTAKGATVRILSAEPETYEDYYISPSSGNFTRDKDPSQMPRTEGVEYGQNRFYPEQMVSTGNVYQVRATYGQALSIVPFQYNPVTRTLKVYRNIELEVTFHDASQKKSAENDEWSYILKNHFINYDDAGLASKTRFSPVPANGNLLIVTKAKYLETLKPFVKWKMQKGIRTYILNIDTLTGGGAPVNIQLYIKNNYQSLNLSYVLLIGDNNDIAPLSNSSLAGPSDAGFAYVAGTDHYPDLMVGRFSAETATELQVQIDRTIAYEKMPLMTPTWYKQAVGVASNEGPGDDNEYDWEHMRNIRTKLMTNGGGYTQVAELYDGTHGGQDVAGNATTAQMKTALNNGASVVNYCGHGASDYLVTTEFSNSDVAQLTNDNGAWPLVWGVACVSGEFENQTCLGEQLLRQTRPSSGKPSGAIAAFFSTINQYWSPPMRAQDAYVDLMTTENTVQHTLGTLTTTGTMSMNDAYDEGGFDMTDTWVLFGDPTVKLQYRTIDPMQVTHAATINKNGTQISLNVNVPGAKAVLYYQDTILSIATVNGGMSQHTFLPVTVLDSIWVTVTADFHKPYTGYIRVIAGNTGIEEQEKDQGTLTIYPNPASGQLSIKGLTGVCHYRCYNAAGALVIEGTVSPAGNTIDISALTAGQYFLKTTGKDMKQSLPFQVLK